MAKLTGGSSSAETPVPEEGATTCCYAQSEKSWVMDPQRVAWETFGTFGESTALRERSPSEANIDLTRLMRI